MNICFSCDAGENRYLFKIVANDNYHGITRNISNGEFVAACECGLPVALFIQLKDTSFEDLAWMSHRCPSGCGLCCIRTAAMKSIFK